MVLQPLRPRPLVYKWPSLKFRCRRVGYVGPRWLRKALSGVMSSPRSAAAPTLHVRLARGSQKPAAGGEACTIRCTLLTSSLQASYRSSHRHPVELAPAKAMGSCNCSACRPERDPAGKPCLTADGLLRKQSREGVLVCVFSLFVTSSAVEDLVGAVAFRGIRESEAG